jgi:MFS family permease
LPIGKRWGLKPLVIAGALLTAAQYPIYAEVHGVGWPLLANAVLVGVASTLYWPSYHAYFASLGDAEHRGHQVGIREAAATIIGIVAPLVGAWMLLNAGPRWMFGAVAAVQALSAAPLLAAPMSCPRARRPALTGPRAKASQSSWSTAGRPPASTTSGRSRCSSR